MEIRTKIRKYLLCAAGALAVTLALAPAAMGQRTLTDLSLATSVPPFYHRFLVADLGLSGRGKPNPIFVATIGGSNNASQYYLYIEVRDSGGQVLLSGNSGQTDAASIPGSVNNYDVLKVFGEGDYSVNESAQRYEEIIRATGELPYGTFTISVTLFEAPATPRGTDSVNVTIKPPYFQPVYPVDLSTTRDMLVFRWVTNIHGMELHLFTDPQGNREFIMGNRLPRRGLGEGTSLEGSSIAPVLDDGATYYWQVWGSIYTSHGDERVKGPLSRFLYFETSASVKYLGLSDRDKLAIKDELIYILEKIVKDKRAAKSIRELELDRMTLDNAATTRDEVMAILKLIKENEVKVESIYFR